MAFKFTWPTFSPSFYETASNLLTSALSKAPTPPIITDNIVVKEFNLGTTAPDLEMLEIGELGDDKFRGVFKLKYSGDAYIVLQTKVQANPLNTRTRISPSFTSRGILAADAPLTVPMFLRLSSFQLSGIIILVFSKQKGLTLVFRNDPVDSVKVSSTFDSIPAIQRFLQAEIERLLRDLMREEVPAIIHKLSLEWAMRNQADECVPPASLTNTHSENPIPVQNYPYPLDADANDPLRPIFSATNLHRLSELALAQHTLSPFTASIPQSVFRSSTSLIASLRPRTMRHHESYSAKSSEAEVPHYRQSDTSPPESVHSVQSTDVSLRPSLYSRRQRSSYLRRSHAPKRKVVRLHPSRSDRNSDAASVYTETSEQTDYFSEPGGYRSSYQTEPLGLWNEKTSAAREKDWEMDAFSKGWNKGTDETEKYGDNSWMANQRYVHSSSRDAVTSK